MGAKKMKCPDCNGSGYDESVSNLELMCSTCNGTGKIYEVVIDKDNRCPACKGRGYLGSFFNRSPCYTCNETGKIQP